MGSIPKTYYVFFKPREFVHYLHTFLFLEARSSEADFQSTFKSCNSEVVLMKSVVNHFPRSTQKVANGRRMC